MANADNAAPRSSLGWLPKLVLWGVVIAFGYLYLSSIDREEGKPTTAAFMDSLAKLSPVPINILPNSQKGEASSVEESKAVAEEPKVVATTAVEEREPVREAESSVFANSLIKQQQAPAPAVVEQKVEAPVSAPATPAPGFMSQPMPMAPTFAAPTRAPAQTAAPVPAQEAPAVADAPLQQMPSSAAAPTSSYDWEAAKKRRAEMMAQYEAMRREADARMRQQWEQMRTYAPPAPYGYGYPGYGPAAYPPGVYAPAQ